MSRYVSPIKLLLSPRRCKSRYRSPLLLSTSSTFKGLVLSSLSLYLHPNNLDTNKNDSYQARSYIKTCPSSFTLPSASITTFHKFEKPISSSGKVPSSSFGYIIWLLLVFNPNPLHLVLTPLLNI